MEKESYENFIKFIKVFMLEQKAINSAEMMKDPNKWNMACVIQELIEKATLYYDISYIEIIKGVCDDKE